MANTTTIYEVEASSYSDTIHYPTKAEAVDAAREAGVRWRAVEVIRPTNREDICNLVNGSNFAVEFGDWEDPGSGDDFAGSNWAAVTLNSGVIAIANTKSEIVNEVAVMSDTREEDARTTRTADGRNWEWVPNPDIVIGRISDLKESGYDWAFDALEA